MDQQVNELNPLLENEELFEVEKLLNQEQQKQKQLDPSEMQLKTQKRFLEICEIVEMALKGKIDINENVTAEDQKEWVERQHNAVIGNKEAVTFFTEEIKNVLREQNISFKDYPSFYENLAQAVFHEIWGLSVLAKWDKYSDSEAALIQGTSLWIDFGKGNSFELQPERFSSPGVVERVKKTFIHRREDSILNRETPQLEIEREDGSRITMIQPPLSIDNYVIFRRFVVDVFSLEQQSSLETIPNEDIPIYRALSKTMANMIVAGPVKSAKTTFMKTLIGERPKKITHVSLEKHFELGLTKSFPGRLFFEFQSKEGDLHKVIPSALRMEHDSMIVGEIRSLEIEAFLQSTERGVRGALSSYHLTNVKRVVRQLTNHAMDAFPNRRYEAELERVANAVDIIIAMAPDRDKKRKRVIAVAEVIWNDETQTHHVQELIKYNPINGQYSYFNKISDELLLLLANVDVEQTKILINTLKKRHEQFPMNSKKQIQDLQEILGVDKQYERV